MFLRVIVQPALVYDIMEIFVWFAEQQGNIMRWLRCYIGRARKTLLLTSVMCWRRTFQPNMTYSNLIKFCCGVANTTSVMDSRFKLSGLHWSTELICELQLWPDWRSFFFFFFCFWNVQWNAGLCVIPKWRYLLFIFFLLIFRYHPSFSIDYVDHSSFSIYYVDHS